MRRFFKSLSVFVLLAAFWIPVSAVEAEDISRAAARLKLRAVYLLSGKEVEYGKA